MTILITPPLLLTGYVQTLDSVAQWAYTDPNGNEVDLTYQWNLYMTINVYQHIGNQEVPGTTNPGVYTFKDVKVGDWIASGSGGLAVQIIAIDSNSTTTDVLYCTVEDIDRYNTFYNSNYDGSVPAGGASGVVFRLGPDDGLPSVEGLPDGFMGTIGFQTDLLSRFTYRNKTNYVQINQSGHNFQIGDIIRINSSNQYEKSIADKNVGLTIGIVTEVSIPTVDWFMFKPLGTVLNNVAPALTGSPGTLYYIDPTTAGTLTSIKPAFFARPVYMRLNNNTTALLLQSGITSDVGAGQVKEQEFTPTTDQTTFVITDPSVASVLNFAVNGIEDENFTFDVNSRTVTIDTTKVGYSLDSSDNLIITYITY